MLFSQLSKENIWKSVFQRELVQWRSRAGIFWWYSRAQFKRRFAPQTAVQFLKKMPQLTQTAVSPHTMVRIVNLCLNCAPLCTKRFMLYYATEPAPSEKPIFFEVRIRWTWATPPNSEIIFVQNVGAKVEMISYLKKMNENENIKTKKKSWEPFRSYLLNSTANPAHFHSNWAGLAVLFSR